MVMVSDGEDDTWVRISVLKMWNVDKSIWSQVVVQRQCEGGCRCVQGIQHQEDKQRRVRKEKTKKVWVFGQYAFAEQLINTSAFFTSPPINNVYFWCSFTVYVCTQANLPMLTCFILVSVYCSRWLQPLRLVLLTLYHFAFFTLLK